jgi:hydrogenase expression/formation protein HypD
VTSAHDVNVAIAMAALPGTIVATYGDLVRVPGTEGSLEVARARGADVRVVYSATDAVALAHENPSKTVVLIGIGFETTSPTVAASVLKAEQLGLSNFLVLPLLKVTPVIMSALLQAGELKLDGIICPGHVSVITGTEIYAPLPKRFGVGCVVTGFEPLDILRSVRMLVEQVESGAPSVQNAYERAVAAEGNPVAREMVDRVFTPCDADWRGIGSVANSGLTLNSSYSRFDALATLKVVVQRSVEPQGCRCGDILRGAAIPGDCALFGKACTPARPVGPCMVSGEGACAAHFAYRTDS